MKMQKKVIYICFLLVIVIACALPFYRVDKDVSFNDMQKQVVKLVDQRELKQEDRLFVRKQYQLHENDYEKIICYGALSAMEVNEFTVVRFENDTQKAAILKQLQARVDKQYQSFSGYAPRQAQLLKDASLYVKGGYVILIVHKDRQKMKEDLDVLF